MVTTKRLRPTSTLLLVLLAVAGMLPGCTDDTDWARRVDPPGGASGRVLRPVTVDSSVQLVGFADCESDLEALEEARRTFRDHELDAAEHADDSYATDVQAPIRDMAEASRSADDAASVGPGATGDGTRASSSASGSAGPPTTMTADPSDGVDNSAAGENTSGDVVAGTNLVEADVDEADIIKTDGRRIVTLRNGVLRVTVLDADPGTDGSITVEEGGDTAMYLVDDTVTIISTVYGAGPFDGDARAVPGSASEGPTADIFYAVGRTRITQVDISDPTRPTVTDSVDVDGSTASSRAVDGRIHVVISTDSAGVLPQVAYDGGAPLELGGCEDVRYETAPSGPGDDAPRSTPTPPDGHEQWTPRTASGPTISVLSFTDLSEGIDPTVITGTAGIVYGSTRSLYIASPLWDIGSDGTAVHRFELTDDGPVTYVGSGLVPGQLLNEFALSELDDTLRLVTTVEPKFDHPTIGIEPSMTTSSDGDDAVRSMPEVGTGAQPLVQRSTRITNLSIGDMREVGHLDGLAPGEDVRSVRFIGTMGYVVTFERTDPLFAIDLADPKAPVVLGELEIPGFSEYLHPIGNGLLLGIGRSVDPDTLWDGGLKISLFDVSDPHRPTELDSIFIRDAYSPVAYDHHAFTWDPVRRRAIIPVEGACDPSGRPGTMDDISADFEDPSASRRARGGYCGGAAVLSTEDGRLSETARIRHLFNIDHAATPDRSVIVGYNIWTLSNLGLGRSPVDDPATVDVIWFD